MTHKIEPSSENDFPGKVKSIHEKKELRWRWKLKDFCSKYLICGNFRWIKVVIITILYVLLVHNMFRVIALGQNDFNFQISYENFFSEKIICIILLFIGTLYYLDIIFSLRKQTVDCRFDYKCKNSYSVSEYLKHSVVIFSLAFSLGVLGALEVISYNTENVKITDIKDFSTKLDNCVEGFNETFSSNVQYENEIKNDKSYPDIIYCIKTLSVSLIGDEDKKTSEMLYVFYSIFQNVLIALIAIELTTAYFVSGHNQSQSLVTGLLIAAIIDIISFVTLKTVISQPSLPSIDIPRYHIFTGYMLGILSLLSFLSSFEAVQYSQIKIDHSLDRFKILKQLSEIIKTKSEEKNIFNIEAILQDYNYLPRVRILTELLKKNGFHVKCEMFHDLYNNKSFLKLEHYNYLLSSLREKGFHIDSKFIELMKERELFESILNYESNMKLLYALVEKQVDANAFSTLYICLVNELEVEIVVEKVNGSNYSSKKISDYEAITVLEIAGFQNNRYRHEETIEIILDYYVNSNSNSSSNIVFTKSLSRNQS